MAKTMETGSWEDHNRKDAVKDFYKVQNAEGLLTRDTFIKMYNQQMAEEMQKMEEERRHRGNDGPGGMHHGPPSMPPPPQLPSKSDTWNRYSMKPEGYVGEGPEGAMPKSAFTNMIRENGEFGIPGHDDGTI